MLLRSILASLVIPAEGFFSTLQKKRKRPKEKKTAPNKGLFSFLLQEAIRLKHHSQLVSFQLPAYGFAYNRTNKNDILPVASIVCSATSIVLLLHIIQVYCIKFNVY